jgi:hypothetical protein
MPEGYLPDPTMDDFRATPSGTPSAREKRKLTPELDKATKDFGPVKTFLKSLSNAATFGQHDRLQSWWSGTNLDDEHEFTRRISEANPKSAFAGGVAGNVLQTIPMTAGLAAAAPAALGAATLRSIAAREALVGGLSATGEEAVKSAEGRGDFSPGRVLASTALGGAGGAVGGALPTVFGHAKTLLARTADKPLTAAEKAATASAGHEGARHGWTGDAALDLAQRARHTEDPALAAMAANIERLKNRAGPAFAKTQEDAFRAGGLDKFMDASVPKVATRGVNKGAYQEFPEISGKAVGQSRNALQHNPVLTPQGPLPQAARDALDEAYRSRVQLWQSQNTHGTWPTTGPNPGPRPLPQRGEFHQWEDVINPRRNPMSREDLRVTRGP